MATSYCLQADEYMYNTFDEYAEGVYCPVYAGFFGVMGATSAMIFSGAFAVFDRFAFAHAAAAGCCAVPGTQ